MLNILFNDQPAVRFPFHNVLRKVRYKIKPYHRPYLTGMQRVVYNFTKGLDKIKCPYNLQMDAGRFRGRGPVIAFGMGERSLKNLNSRTPLIAAFGWPHPLDFRNFENDYNLTHFLVHSDWVLKFVSTPVVYKKCRFATLAAGIDTDFWVPHGKKNSKREIDVLVYIKIHWDSSMWESILILPILRYLASMGLNLEIVRYGSYTPSRYLDLLRNSQALLFISPHESQGFAYQEALSCDVPVFAWDPGFWTDPSRARLGKTFVAATSVPFFSEDCGLRFSSIDEFEAGWPVFWNKCKTLSFSPRQYVLDKLSLRNSAEAMLDFLR